MTTRSRTRGERPRTPPLARAAQLLSSMAIVASLSSCNAIFGITPGADEASAGSGATVATGGSAGTATGGTGGSAACSDGTYHQWTEAFGNFEAQDQALVALAPDGGTYVAGSFIGAVTIGGDSHGAAGAPPNDDVFIARFAASGALEWSHAYGNDFDQEVAGIAVDDDGNLYIAGRYNGNGGPLDFGGPNLDSVGSYELFVVSYDKAGKHRWTRPIGAPVDDDGIAVAVRDDDVIFAAHYGVGFYADGMEPPDLYSQEGGMVIVHLDAMTGVLGWYTGLSAIGNVAVTGVAIGKDAVFVSGDMTKDVLITYDDAASQQTVTFEGPTRDAFAMAFTRSTGTPLWARSLHGDVNARGVALGPDGTVFLAGDFSGKVSGGPTTLDSQGGRDLFAAAIEHPKGSFSWVRGFGGVGAQTLHSAAANESGDLFIAGGFDGTLDFGCAGFIESQGGADPEGKLLGGDAFVARLNAAGEPLWAARAGDADFQVGLSVAAAGNAVALAGSFYNQLDFGPIIDSAGKSDVFVVRFER